MKKTAKNILHDLSRRERQIVETVLKLGNASVSQVLAEIPDPPTYTSIRTMLQILARKGVLQFKNDGKRYIYSVKAKPETMRTAAVKNLLTTFFSGSIPAAVNAIIDLAGDKLNPEEIEEIQQKIELARK
ncbi:hypothetical protein FACS1894170_02070 [Planctomycetales bacterium]|nr:hypothetical protein FACS1894170_02070 [Planctomycetales bacterium]